MNRYTPTQRQLDAWVANIVFQLSTLDQELFYGGEEFDLRTAVARALPTVAVDMTRKAPDPYVAACVLIEELAAQGYVDQEVADYYRDEVHHDTRQAQGFDPWLRSRRFKNVWSSRRVECFFGPHHEVQACANCRTLRCASCATSQRCACCQRPFQPSYR